MFTALATDAYKLFHKDAYIDGLTKVYGNVTNRNDRLSNIPLEGRDGVMNIGNQFYIKEYLIEGWNETFFNADKTESIKYLKKYVDAILDEDTDVSHFEALHDLGYLPIRIKSLPEGVMVPYGVAATTYQSTHEDFAWLANYLETLHSQCVWPIQTSATTSRAYLKNTIKAYMKAGIDTGTAWFMNHDFSARGMFGPQAAMMSSIGQLSSSYGTDTIEGIMGVEKYYNADVENQLVAKSVYATEHSTATSFIMAMAQKKGISKFEAEIEYVRYLFTKVKENKILSHVSDSFDFWKFVSEGLPLLKKDILARSGTFVVRPDSGDPVEIICGRRFKKADSKEEAMDEMDTIFHDELVADDPHFSDTRYYKIDDVSYKVTYTPELNRHDKTYYYIDNYGNLEDNFEFEEITLAAEDKGLVECLWDIFGGTETEKGYRVLCQQIGAIYGDSITLERQQEIYDRLMEKGFAPLAVLGVGSYSYQFVSRDTHGSAVKATYIEENGNSVNVCKDPKTDAKKKSAFGLLRIEKEHGVYVQYDGQTQEQELEGELGVIFEDSKLIRETSLEEIRAEVSNSIL